MPFYRAWVLFIFLMLASAAAAFSAEPLPRQSLNLNRDWKFSLGDFPGAEAPAYADAAWAPIGLPHSFSEPYFLSPEFYTGYGWYRKHLTIPAAWAKQRFFLEFDGVFQVAEVFVNGQRCGEHQGGYTGFSLDITAAVKPGDNVIAVRVNNQWNPELAPRAGEHVFSGGIYRDVRLVVTAPLHVTWYGTAVTTPNLSATLGVVNIKTEIQNHFTRQKLVTVESDIVDAASKVVATVKSAQTIAAGATVTVEQTAPAIANPQLWSPESPTLYAVATKVSVGGQLLDTYRTPFGFRWFQWTADQGFFLNGAHYYFHGVNAHQDHAGWGDAVTDAGFARDIQLIKEAGFQFIRGSHYPHAPAFAQACDETGLLFWSENCFWGTGAFKNPWGTSAYPPQPQYQAGFEQSVRNSLRDEIRIFRNHPSIIVWSMDNEVFFTAKSTLPAVRKFLKELVALTHELDPSRPAAIGGAQRGDIDKLGDVAGYNGDGARLFLDPGIPSVVSEYGSTVADRPGKYEAGFGDLQTTEFPWRSGQALWCAFDHGSIAGHFGCMGMVDYFRLPKRQYYWYRNEYRHIPPPAWPAAGTPAKLKLTADKTMIHGTDATDDAQVVVTVADAAGTAISNCVPVTLSIESGPGEFPTGPSITFAPDSDIAIRDGQAAIEFRSYYGGETVIRAHADGLADATLTLVTAGTPEFVPGVTPAVPARNYVRFSTKGAHAVEQTFGKDAPTSASSAAPDHATRFANDGDATTFWAATNAATGAWWQMDLERLCTIKAAKLIFPVAGNFQYQISVSDDGQQWRVAADESATSATTQSRTDTCAAGNSGRYVRISFTGQPPNTPAELSEVQIIGSVRSQ